MKKIKSIFFLALVVLTLNSCEDKEQTINFVQENYLEGKWIFKQQGLMNSQSGIDFSDVNHYSTCQKDNIVFNEDMTFVVHDFSFNANCTETIISGTYERVNNLLTLHITIGENVVHKNYTITKLTKNELEYNFSNGSELFFIKAEKE